MEDKHERFLRVIKKRLANIYENIRLIDNIAVNKCNVYAYSDDELLEMLEAIQMRLDETKELVKRKGVRFKL